MEALKSTRSLVPAPITTNDNFWDCECHDVYIHHKTHLECNQCGATREEQPDSIQHELLEYCEFIEIVIGGQHVRLMYDDIVDFTEVN